MRDFYNTNRMDGEQLNNAMAAAQSQQQKIMLFFRANPSKKFAPHEIRNRLFSEITPITSVRRAMTNLEQDGLLVKTYHMITGEYGKPVHCWRLNGGSQQMELF